MTATQLAGLMLALSVSAFVVGSMANDAALATLGARGFLAVGPVWVVFSLVTLARGSVRNSNPETRPARR